jgi:hypothetical protein
VARLYLLEYALHVVGRDQVLPAEARIERRLFRVLSQKVAKRFGADAQKRSRLFKRQDHWNALVGCNARDVRARAYRVRIRRLLRFLVGIDHEARV